MLQPTFTSQQERRPKNVRHFLSLLDQHDWLISTLPACSIKERFISQEDDVRLTALWYQESLTHADVDLQEVCYRLFAGCVCEFSNVLSTFCGQMLVLNQGESVLKPGESRPESVLNQGALIQVRPQKPAYQGRSSQRAS